LWVRRSFAPKVPGLHQVARAKVVLVYANRLIRSDSQDIWRPRPDEFRTPPEFGNGNLAQYSVVDERLTDGLRTVRGQLAACATMPSNKGF
jgi:hypothetical protein